MPTLFKANLIAARMKDSNKYTLQRLLAFFKGDTDKLTPEEVKEVRKIIEKELKQVIPK